MKDFQTIREEEGAVVILDQTKLPRETAFVRLKTLADVAHAIRVMQVRGAPLIGATAAYGVALGLREGRPLDEVIAILGATRPTAVNLHWALNRLSTALKKSTAAGQGEEVAWAQARAIAREDAESNAAIGRHGLTILEPIAAKKGRVEVMTHCNAGCLATVAHGTALAPVYAAQAAGIEVHVWVSETRPRNQGLLSAWELMHFGVPCTLIADNAAGLMLMRGQVDCIIVGADRIAANGDTANKIGTYLKALAAQAHERPFYVAAPVSTIDFACANGDGIPIEERDADELGAGDVCVANPAFDITPASLITGIITERGILAPGGLGRLRGC